MGILGTEAVDFDLGGGNRLYVGGTTITTLRFADGEGRATLDLAVPNQSSLRGGQFSMQWAVFDPQGSFGGQLALSDAARLSIGD